MKLAVQSPYPPRKTRIIATVGPSSDQPEKLHDLANAGVNVFRLNFSHAKHDWAKAVVVCIREIERQLQRPLGIMMDTQGPGIRTGELPDPISLKEGQIFTFTVRGEKGEAGASVEVNYDQLVDDVAAGDIMLVDNGMIRMKVLEKGENKIRCEVLAPSTLGSRRHINLPGVHVSLPSITDKDFSDVRWGVANGLDFVALSFVRSREDIEQMRAFLRAQKSTMRIIAKIEGQQAIDNFNDILTSADGIMIARGDLGIELPFEELPITQRRIVKECFRVGKPVIVATQLLESMHENPMPTRAEVTDVSNAVYEQADALMLSGETSVGRYPVKCVETLDIISRRVERSGGANFVAHAELSNNRQKIISSAIMLATQLKASGMVVFTHRGDTAQLTSWLRPQLSHIYAFTPEESVWRQMSLLWGVRAFKMNLHAYDPEATVLEAIATIKKAGLVKTGDMLVFASQIQARGELYDSVQPRRVP